MTVTSSYARHSSEAKDRSQVGYLCDGRNVSIHGARDQKTRAETHRFSPWPARHSCVQKRPTDKSVSASEMTAESERACTMHNTYLRNESLLFGLDRQNAVFHGSFGHDLKDSDPEHRRGAVSGDQSGSADPFGEKVHARFRLTDTVHAIDSLSFDSGLPPPVKGSIFERKNIGND